jgi:hypothetical protein
LAVTRSAQRHSSPQRSFKKEQAFAQVLGAAVSLSQLERLSLRVNRRRGT